MADESIRTLDEKRKEAEAEKAALEVVELRLKIAALQQAQITANAKAAVSNIYTFDERVGQQSVRECMNAIGEWSRRGLGEPITIIFNSPGGSIIAGLALYDYIQQLRALGHNVTTVALGMAASMGGILLQAGDRRVIGAHSFLLIHEASFGSGGKASEVEESLQFVERLQVKLVDILCEHSRLTPATIRRKWKKTDWWLDAQECLNLGLVDEIQ